MFNKALFNKKEVVAVALSGGMDLVCLAHLLHTHANSLGITVKAINVEHGIRGEASLKDSAFVVEFCKSLNIPLKSYAVDVPKFCKNNGCSEEQGARILRYECFDNALIEGFCDKIATAHHADDNAETVLFNLFRGSALSGLCGIPEISHNGKIIRPLLNCTKQQIQAYVSENGLNFVHDESNDLNKYTRNFLRNEVLPTVEQKFGGAICAINRFSNLAKADEKLLCEMADGLISGNSVKFTDQLHLPIFSRACLKVMQKMGITKDFESVHITAVYNLKDCQTGKSIDLKNGVKAYKSKDCVVFERAQEQEDFEVEIALPFEYQTPYYDIKIQKISKPEKGCLCFDGDKLPSKSVLRLRRTGDKILTFGGVTKTLKKFFNDRKIDARISKNLPIIAMEDEIYAVCSVDISKRLKVDSTTKNIYKIICKRKGE